MDPRIQQSLLVNRREFFGKQALGLGTAALSGLLAKDGFAAAPQNRLLFQNAGTLPPSLSRCVAFEALPPTRPSIHADLAATRCGSAARPNVKPKTSAAAPLAAASRVRVRVRACTRAPACVCTHTIAHAVCVCVLRVRVCSRACLHTCV